MKKKILVTVLAAVLSLSMSVTSLAAGWQSDTKGTWYQNDDGSYPTNGWQWIDGNQDGTAECYYFDANGYMLANTTTPDGYQVNSDGAWVVNGVVQTQGAQNNQITNTTVNANENEIAAAVARAKAAGAGKHQDSCMNGGWRTDTTWNGVTNHYIRPSKDQNGMIISPTSGVVMTSNRNGNNREVMASGSDKSITLSYDPSNGNLQPNWIYNPTGKVSNPPAVIAMDKNTYKEISSTLGDSNGTMRVVSCDTSGNWVYNPNPTGSSSSVNMNGQLSGWMYRYADGTYAANGIAYIYDDGATWDESANNLAGSFVIGQAYIFNENGFLLTNSNRGAVYIDEYGRVCDGTAGPFFHAWYYDK